MTETGGHLRGNKDKPNNHNEAERKWVALGKTDEDVVEQAMIRFYNVNGFRKEFEVLTKRVL